MIVFICAQEKSQEPWLCCKRGECLRKTAKVSSSSQASISIIVSQVFDSNAAGSKDSNNDSKNRAVSQTKALNTSEH